MGFAAVTNWFRRKTRYGSTRLLFGDDQWTDYEFTVEAMRAGGENSFSLLFRSADPDNEFDYTVAGNDNRACYLYARARGRPSRLESRDFNLRDGVWYTARVRVRGSHLVGSIYDNQNGRENSSFRHDL